MRIIHLQCTAIRIMSLKTAEAVRDARVLQGRRQTAGTQASPAEAAEAIHMSAAHHVDDASGAAGGSQQSAAANLSRMH